MSTTSQRILVIDDEQAICLAFQRFFQARGWTVQVASGVTRGRALYRENRPDVVFLDVRLGDGNGLDLLASLREEDSDACVVVITAYGSLDTANRALRSQAFDFLVKPLDLDKAAELADAAWHRRPAVAGVYVDAEPDTAAANPGGIVGTSPAMQALYKQIACIAMADETVLVTGETGVGKELVVRAIHEYSERRARPFLAVNCGALPEHLVESELFGHVRGAFTGAHADRPGRFECADGGTLFLDEVGELPLPAQAKLLRVLDSGVVERLGSSRPLKLAVRVITATNRNLEEEIQAGRFRADLYYRLAVLRIEVPRLAERMGDVPLLASHFLARRASGAGRFRPALSPEAAVVLQAYSWPGNVRELKHVIEQAAVLATGGVIRPEHLPALVREGTGAVPGRGDAADFHALVAAYLAGPGRNLENLHQTVVEVAEAEAIRFALAGCDGNQTEAAARLGIHRNTLRNRIQALKLGPETAA